MMVGWEGTANDSRIFLDTTTEPENGHYRHRENTILWTQALRLCLKVFLLTVLSIKIKHSHIIVANSTMFNFNMTF